VAIREGHAFADTVFGDLPTWSITTSYRQPCSPRRRSGSSAAPRRAPGSLGDIDVYKASFRAMKATLSGRDERIFMKVIVDRATDKVVGSTCSP
jgi:glutathione reductase (NADPH)